MDGEAHEHPKTLLWHRQVHERFNEFLYYYLISYRSDVGTFYNYLKEGIRAAGVRGFSIYEVFGTADFLLRLWLNRQTAMAVSKLMDDPRLTAVGAFRAFEQHHWAFRADPPESEIRKINEDVVRRAQGGDRATIERLTQSGLCKEENISEGVKFFIVVDQPKTLAVSAVTSIKAMLTRNHAAPNITQKSVYFGNGFAWALVKGVAARFFDIRGLMIEINQSVQPFGMWTTTLIFDQPALEECEHISESSLNLGGVAPHPQVWGWLRELYEHPSRVFIRKVEEIVEKIIELSSDGYLTTEDEETLREYLRGLVAGDLRKAAASLAYWFLTRENALHEQWRRAEEKDTATAERLYKSCNVEDRKRLTLGNLLNLMIALGATRGEQLPKDHGALVKEIGDLRNRVHHGNLREFLENWNEHLDILSGHFRLHRWFCRLAG